MSDKITKEPVIRFDGFTDAWEQRKLGDLLKYEQPTKYIVKSTDYDDSFITPVLTAGQSFILGYTNETESIKEASDKNPVIIFDDFTTGSHYVDFPFKVKSSAMKLLSLKSEDEDFYLVYNILKNVKYVPQSHERHWISKFSEFSVAVPNYGEQVKVGKFFKHLDHLITLHQREYEIAQKFKKTMLSKMFPKNGADKPELRFAGFTDAWEQRKLSEISNKVTEKNKDNLYSETLTNSAEHGIINQRDFFDKNISNEKNLDGYYVVREDDFVYNPRISNFAPVGPIKRNKLGRTGVMSPLYYVIRTHDIDKSYLEYYFDATGWHKFMKLNGDSGARADRFAIKDSVFKEMPIPYPSLDEQAKIGKFFDELTNLITLHQRELESLKSIKQSLVQQMFV